MNDSSLLEQIAPRIEGPRRERGRVVVGIDGRGGAGNSSLALALVARLSRTALLEHEWSHIPKDQVSPA
jgi:uridine kinase